MANKGKYWEAEEPIVNEIETAEKSSIQTRLFVKAKVLQIHTISHWIKGGQEQTSRKVMALHLDEITPDGLRRLAQVVEGATNAVLIDQHQFA